MIQIRRLRENEPTRSCGIGLHYLYPWEGAAPTPFGTAWCRVEPGEATHRHGHHEAESFFIVAGSGILEADGESQPVEAGDVIYFPPFTRHTLCNRPGQPPLTFLTVWWEDPALAQQRAGAAREETGPVLLFASPPTPNGDLHLGHLSGPYLAADVHRRYLRQRGIPAYLIYGSDDYQSYVIPKAASRGEPPAETARHFSQAMLDTLERYDALPDQYTLPQDLPGYREAVQQYFLDLQHRGVLVRKRAPAPYCDTCERFLFDVFISGTCPHCGEPCGGGLCEQCGHPNQGVDIVDPVCSGCGGRPGQREIERFYLPVSRYEEAVRDSLSKCPMSAHLERLIQELLAEGLPDLAVTQVCDWGIPVPVEGFEGQVLWAWFEMAAGFRIGLRELGKRLGWAEGPHAAGPPFPGSRAVQFFGFDNGYYFCLLFRALYAADGYGWDLLEAFVSNELYRLEGAKFSTGRNHLIWGRDFLDKVPVDVARFYLCWDRPETEQTDFRMEELAAVVRRELLQGWQAWLLDLGARVRDRFGGLAPEPGHWNDEHRELFHLLGRSLEEVGRALETRSFSPQRAARRLCELVREARRFAAGQAHRGASPDGRDEERTAVALELATARALATAAAPLMPGFAARLWRDLGCPGSPQDHGWPDVPAWVPAGAAVRLEQSFFPDVAGPKPPLPARLAIPAPEERIPT